MFLTLISMILGMIICLLVIIINKLELIKINDYLI
jgi:hypothetical protein